MKPLFRNLFMLFIVVSIGRVIIVADPGDTTPFASTIQGTVYDKQRNTLPEVDIELLNDYGQSLNRTKTDATGRYYFTGLSDGRFSVRAYAFRYDLIDQEIPVEIQTMTVRGTEGISTVVQDFYLQPKKGGLKESELGVVFAQDIPKEAQDIYDRAIRSLNEKRADEGFADLQKAIELFPNYYNALYRYGLELFMRKQYLPSAGVFLKAVDVNPKSATSFYYLAYSLHNLGKKYEKSARTAALESNTLAPASIQVLVLLGKIERAMGEFTEAESHLLKAKKLSTSKVPEIHKELAQLYANDMNKYSEAADELELYLKASNATGEDAQKTRKLIETLRAKAKT